MIPYYVLMFTPILLYIWLLNNKEYSSQEVLIKNKRIFCVLCGVILFLFIALRSNAVGSTDSLNYYNHWLRYREMDLSTFFFNLSTSSMEKGYLITVWVLSHILRNPQFLFVLSGILFSTILMRFIYKYSDDPLLAFEIYVCLGLLAFNIQGMRQSIAMSICLLSIDFVLQKKPIKFLALIFLASLFHQTAIVFIVVYFMKNRRATPLNYCVYSALGLVILFGGSRIVSIANNVFDREYSMVVNSGGFVATAILLFTVIEGVLSSFIDERYVEEFSIKRELVYERNFFVLMVLTGFVIFVMRYTAAHAAQRISMYFLYAQIIVMPNSLRVFENRSRILLWCLILIGSIALFMYRIPREGLYPYLYFWQ